MFTLDFREKGDILEIAATDKEKKVKKKKPSAEFEKGELVVYGSSGVCKVNDIIRLTTPGTRKKNYYYCLVPVDNESSRIYALVGQDKVKMRHIISHDEAMSLIDSAPELSTIDIKSDKTREDQYKSAIQSCDCRELFRIIKTLHARNERRLKQGRKITSTDERYMKEAKKSLYTELSVVLDINRDDIEDFIGKRIAKA